jgi:hypothetical protein
MKSVNHESFGNIGEDGGQISWIGPYRRSHTKLHQFLLIYDCKRCSSLGENARWSVEDY